MQSREECPAITCGMRPSGRMRSASGRLAFVSIIRGVRPFANPRVTAADRPHQKTVKTHSGDVSFRRRRRRPNYADFINLKIILSCRRAGEICRGLGTHLIREDGRMFIWNGLYGFIAEFRPTIKVKYWIASFASAFARRHRLPSAIVSKFVVIVRV